MRDPDPLLALADETLSAALAAGADEAEAYVSAAAATSMSAVGGFCSPRSVESLGVGVRVIVDERPGFAGASGPDAAQRAIAQALAAARRVARLDTAPLFAEPRPVTRPPTTVDPRLDELEPARLQEAVLAARDALSRAGHVDYATLSVTSRTGCFAVANTRGVSTWDRRARETFTMEARVKDGAGTQTALEVVTSSGPLAPERDVLPAVEGAAQRASDAIGGGSLLHAMDTVVLAPGPAAQLVRQFAHAFSARHVQAGRSALSGRMGEQITSEAFTLTDEPWTNAGGQLARVDHEGMPTAPLALVEAGRLANYLHDATTAAASKREPTGHGLRTTGLNGGIQIAPHRLHVRAGGLAVDEVMQASNDAVLITDPITGAFTTDVATGSFSLVAPYAFLLRRGRIEHALGPTTLGGNLYSMLDDVRAVGRDVTERIEGRVPTLCLGGVSCAT